MKNNITLRDVYEIVERLEVKIDNRITKIEDKVDKLEGFENRVYGIAGLISLAIGSGIAFIWNKVFGK